MLPSKYSSLQDEKAWDAVVHTEELRGALAGQVAASPIAAFIDDAFALAIKKYERGGFVVDSSATNFWSKYQQLCDAEFSDLQMTPLQSRQSRNDPWPRFATGALPLDVKLDPKNGRLFPAQD